MSVVENGAPGRIVGDVPESLPQATAPSEATATIRIARTDFIEPKVTSTWEAGVLS
jgi:hypothetical protein